VAPNVWIPTQAALRLSLDLLATEAPPAVPNVVRKTAMPDIWALTSADERVIGLYRTGRIEAMMHDFLHEISPAGVVFVAYPPDERADVEAIAAGPWLPGWQLSFIPLESTRFDDLARRRRAVYLSVATIGIGLIVLVGVAAAGGLRRHLHLARLKTDLVAAASHELRTPVASMRVLLDGLLADQVLEPVKTREYLQLLGTESARLSRQIESFLTFARLDRRHYRFALTPTAPSTLVDSALEAIRDRVPPGASIAADVEAALPVVDADPEMMTTALANVLDNAVKYAPIDTRIDVQVRRDHDWIAFAVRDNGIGIASSEQKRIFRRFYQVDQRLARETGGVGLGLSIVDLIVRGHRGRLDVKSEPGRGSTFVIYLPIAKELAA
jgi:two-component system phosphate regulon sensor histidine kinase PhoR